MKEILYIMNELFLSLGIVIYEIIISAFQFIFQRFHFNNKSIRNEIVVLTGAANGLGRWLCMKMAKQGCIIIAVDIDENGLCETKNIVFKETDQFITTYVCDIRFKENIIKLGNYVKENFGHVDILVNNAGIVNGKYILDLTPDEIKETFEVNTFSNFYFVQEFLPQMLTRSHGHIVFISSIAGYVSTPSMGDYCASKAAIILLSETLLSEIRHVYKNNDVNITTVTPFLIKTGMFQGCSSRFQFLMPDLDPEYVADKIVQAIQKNQIHLSISRINYFLFAIKTILPVKAMMELYKFTGCLSFLERFVNNRGSSRQINYQKINKEEYINNQ